MRQIFVDSRLATPAVDGEQKKPLTSSKKLVMEKSLLTVSQRSDISIEIGGETINIPLNVLDLNRLSLPDKGATYLYQKLSERAMQGDIIAARLLSEFLTRCSEVFVNLEDHNNSLKLLRENGEYPSANPKFSGIHVDESMIAGVEQQFSNEFASCEGLSVEQKKESSKWAEVAAKGGDFLGLDALIKNPSVAGERKIELMKKQWKDFGYIDGATGIAAVLSGLSRFPDYKGVEPDPKTAYAYFLIASNINVAFTDSSKPFEAVALNVEYGEFESLLSSKLSPQEHLEAEQMAIELITSNPNCCAIDTVD